MVEKVNMFNMGRDYGTQDSSFRETSEEINPYDASICSTGAWYIWSIRSLQIPQSQPDNRHVHTALMVGHGHYLLVWSAGDSTFSSLSYYMLTFWYYICI